MNGRYIADGLLVDNRLMGPEYTGKLTSPPFEISRRYINFLAAARVDYVKLVIDGETVCRGERDPSIPFDRVTPLVFDVSEYQGKTATIEVVDEGKKWREHVLVDHFVFSNSDLRESWMQATIDEIKSQSIQVLGRQYYVGKVPVSYENALDLAKVLGGQVLTIESEEEAEALAPYVASNSWLGITNEDGVWKDDQGQVYTHQTWTSRNSSGLPTRSDRKAVITAEGDCGTTNQSLAYPVIEFGPKQNLPNYELTKAVENRRLAEYLLQSQATFTLAVADRYLYQWSYKGSSYSDSLPSERFEVRQITLPKGFKVDRDVEARFDFDNQIRDLRIENGNDDSLRIIRHLPRLQHLVIDKGEYKTWAGLTGLKSGHPLKHFELRSVGFQAEQIQPLFEAEELRSVSFHSTRLSPEIGTMLLPHKKSLVSYWSNACYGLDREGFQALGQQERLRNAMLWASDVRDEDLEHLGKIASLETTQLGGNSAITGKSFEQLKGWVNMKELSLWGNSVDDQGISNLPLLPSLHRLTLGKSKITNSSLTRISQLPALENLDISENGLDNEGIEELLSCKLLRRIKATDTGVTRSGLATFFEKLPGFRAEVDEKKKVAPPQNVAPQPQTPPLAVRKKPVVKVSGPRIATPGFSGPESVDAFQLSQLPTFAQAKDQPAFKKAFEGKKARMQQYPQFYNHLIVGRIELEGGADPSLIKSYSDLLPDGTFVHITRDLKYPLAVRALGFEPTDIQLSGCQGQIIDVGTVVLNRLSEESSRTIWGQLQLADGGDPSSGSISLSVLTGSRIVSYASGFGRHFLPVDSKDGKFLLEGLAPHKYRLAFSASGFVYQTVSVDLTNGKLFDLGQIRLEKQRTVQLKYIVAEDSTGKTRFNSGSIEKKPISGGQSWNVRPGNTTFSFHQGAGKLKVRGMFGTTQIKDLGPGQLSDFLDVEKSSDGMSNRLDVQTGHVYLVRAEYLKAFILLEIDAIESDDAR